MEKAAKERVIFFDFRVNLEICLRKIFGQNANLQRRKSTLHFSNWKHEAQILLGKIVKDRPVRITALCIAFSIFFIILAYGITTGQSGSVFLTNISYEIGLKNDGSSSEVVGYGLAFMAAVLFFLGSIETGSRLLLTFSLCMIFVWFDDSAEFHERFGEWLHKSYDWNQGLSEMFAWLCVAFILLPLFVYSFRKLRPGDGGVFVLVFCGGALLVACGVVADLVHSVAPRIYDLPLTIIEDGGELVAIAWIAILALGLSRNGREYYHEATKE